MHICAAGQGLSQISYAATSPELSDKHRFPLVSLSIPSILLASNGNILIARPLLQVSRTVAPEPSKAPVLIGLMRQYGWNNVIILTVADTVYFEGGLGLIKLLKEAQLNVFTLAAFESGDFNEAKAREIRRFGVRVVFVLAWESDIVAIASANQGAGWAWVQTEKVGTGSLEMAGWLTIVPFLPSIPTGFTERISNYTKSRFDITVPPSSVDVTFSAALHDAIILYALAATKVALQPHCQPRPHIQWSILIIKK